MVLDIAMSSPLKDGARHRAIPCSRLQWLVPVTNLPKYGVMTPETRPQVILIAGPTASGKSAVSLVLAGRVGGEIVNADSMQIYRELPVLSAAPDAAERARVPHHLYGIASVRDPFSVARWAELAGKAIGGILDRGGTAIVTGGTGLYFRALLGGLSAVPPVDGDVRRQVRDLVLASGAAAGHALLAVEDPVMAERLQPGDGQRIARALEVVRSTGRSLAHWHEAVVEGPLAALDRRGRVGKFALLPPRDWLYERCDRRFDLMMTAGVLDEVAALPPADPDLTALKALGIPQLRAALAGEMAMGEAVKLAKTATRQYAKRQMTWFRNQCADWTILEEKQTERIVDLIFSKISRDGLTEK
ncbi:tRNA (adenosine(37)-N6)-dimethylallyltransferase MiaA [Emcibacter sp. SYSU 3D8]|uniref:tRNA (adenosine(37)-N6)-dimethylallyltransferase MiaA n=1 Tax=Emcibacter sp. SYSU 3D8 TaxID=3133969 RepID=UPI0031FECA4F